YNGYGQLTATVDGRGVSVTRNSSGAASLTADAAKYRSTWNYTDAQGNDFGDLLNAGTPPITTTLNGTTSTGPVTTANTPDDDGEIIAMLSPTQNPSQYTYDHLGRLTVTTQPPIPLADGGTGSPNLTRGYDGDGNLIDLKDGLGDETRWSYDPLGRLVST